MSLIPKITLISHSDHPESDAGIRWLVAQESPSVDVVLVQGQSDRLGHRLAQVLPQLGTELFCWLEPGVEFSAPNWHALLYELWCDADVDLLGGGGLTEISVRNLRASVSNEQLQVSRVVASAPVAGRAERMSVEPAVALGAGFVMGNVAILGQWLSGIGGILQGKNLMEFSLQAKLFGDLRLGVAHHFPVRGVAAPSTGLSTNDLKALTGFLPLSLPASRIWQKNLAALQVVRPELIGWLAESCSRSPWTHIERRGSARLRLHGEIDAIVADVAINAAPNDVWWLLGAGTGEGIDGALSVPGVRLEVLEPDAVLLCYLLSRHDWAQALESGRLGFHPWDAQHVLWKQMDGRLLLAKFRSDLLNDQYPTYCTTGGSFYLHEAILKEMQQGMHRIWTRLKECAQWKAERAPVFDVTVVSPQCAIFKDLAESFHRLGYNTRLLNVKDGSTPLTWQEDRLHALNLIQRGSSLTVFRNRSFLESDQWQEPMPLSPSPQDRWVSWWWDVPNIASVLDQVAEQKPMPALGFAGALIGGLPQGSLWLPPAARTAYCVIEPVPDGFVRPLAFVGQSRWHHVNQQLAILRAVVPDYLAISRVHSESVLCNRWRWCDSAIELYQMMRQDEPWLERAILRLAQTVPARAYYLEYVWKMAVTGLFRMAAIELLVREGLPVHVFGDDGWVSSSIVPAERFGGVLSPNQLPEIYRSTQLNLNLDYMQVSSTVNPRVLDICATNAMVLTSYQQELDILFPRPEARPAHFSNLEELPSQVRQLLAEDLRPRAMRCGEWVRSRHTMQHRAVWFAEHYGLRVCR
ncbi:Hypothetical protein HDN1F_13640 [gamma proteobacterium HdN1]|nr:Hypothetical protein HDN1F_13640 [gamma proteobacterium HdN1]